MLIYNIIFGINFILSFMNIKNIKSKKQILLISFIIMNIFLCLSYTNGIDWAQYHLNFLKILSFDEMVQTKNYYMNIPERNKGEIVFYYLMSIFKMFEFNYEIFQYLFLTITMIAIYKLMSKFTEYAPLGIFLYAILFMIPNFLEPLLRQFLSITLFYLGINNILNKNLKKYSIKIFIACLLHSSSVILIFVYFIPKIKIKLSKIIILIFGAFIGDVYLELILDLLVKLFPILIKYLNYFKSNVYGIKNNINIVILIKIIIIIVIGLYVEKNKKYLKMKSIDVFYFVINLYWLNLILFILQNKIIIFYRVKFYFEIFYIIVLLFLMKILIKKYGKGIGIFCLVTISIIYYSKLYNYTQKRYTKYLPYTNYLLEVMFNDEMKVNYEKINFRLKTMKKELRELRN